MFKAAVAHSEDVDMPKAVEELLSQIRVALGKDVPQAGLLFCSVDFDHVYIIAALRSAFPAMELAGCTTDGEMSSRLGFSEDSVVFMALASDSIVIRAGAGRALSVDGMEAGRSAASEALSATRLGKEESKFALMLVDPMNAGVSDVSAGIAQVLGAAFPLFGGASAAHSKRRTTYQFCNGEVLTDSIVLLLFSGPVLFSFGIRGGHSAIGGREKITSSEKNVLRTIGDKPALEYFKRYIGDNYDLFMNYCLAVFEEGRDSFCVRSAPFCDVPSGTVTLNGAVTEGAYIQIGTADRNTCAESCEASVRMALDSYPGKKPAAAFHVSCAGRKKMLGTQAVRESQISKAYLKNVPFAGYYAYGEFSPLEKGSGTMFHGTTFVTLLIGEE